MVGRTDADLFGPEDAGRLASLKRRVLETGEVLRQEVTVTPGGTRHILDLTLEPLRDADGEIVGISGMAVERAEEVCRPGTDTLNLMLRNARDIVYRIELAPVRRFSYISPAVTRIAGYAPKEVYADPEIALRFIHPDELPLLEAVFRGEFAPDRPLISTSGKETPGFNRGRNCPHQAPYTFAPRELSYRQMSPKDKR